MTTPVKPKEKYKARLRDLKSEADQYRAHYVEIAENMVPRKGKYLTSDTDTTADAGKKKHHKIINGAADDALRVLAAGMQGGLTSPSRPWFTLTHPNSELMEYPPVKNWLHEVRQIMLSIYAKSNFYGSIHGLYKELGAFGTSAMLIEQDFDKFIRCRPFTVGEFTLATNNKHKPDTLYRQFSLTARQMVQEFGIDNVSDQVKEIIKSEKNIDKAFEIVHCIQPNTDFKVSASARGMEYESVYFELNADSDLFLRRAGYKTLPFVAPRWDITGVDVYGNSPGMSALGDCKMLQKMEEKKLKALDKMVDPPMNASTSLKAKGGTIVAGGVNYLDTQQGQTGFAPAYQVSPDVQNIAFELDRVEKRIRRYFFNDLFLAVLNQEKGDKTAFEISKRWEEKITMLGPVIERLQSELLDPIVERTFSILLDMDALPPAPPELEGSELKIEYISLLAQAQKMVGTNSIEQTAAFVGNLAAVNPQVVDKFDFDEALDQYASLVGVPPNIVKSDEQVAEERQQRAEAQQAQQAQEQAAQGVQSAKMLSETGLDKNSALDSLRESQQ